MGGIMGIAAALFGLFWTVMVFSSGGGAMGFFGLIFVAVGILNAVRGFRNAFSKNRRSEFDIVDGTEETDSWNERYGNNFSAGTVNRYVDANGNSFCPYCGNTVEKDFKFCNDCGRKLPD